MSDLVKHTLTINISDRIEWIDKRCGLTEIQKDYIAAQMKEAVADAVQQANGITTGAEQCNLPVVSGSFSVKAFHIGFEYEELEMDKNRYFNRGEIWVKKIYSLNSPRLHKIDKLIKEGKIRAVANDR